MPPPDGLARERRRSLLCELLDDLPPPQADALAFRFILGSSLAEIAAPTGVPVNTVRSRVRLAKEALRRRIAASSTLAEALEVIE